MLMDGQLVAAELPAFRPAGAPRVRAAALESPRRREWVEGCRPPEGQGPRRPSAEAAPRIHLGRSDPSSRRAARAKRRAPAAERPGPACAQGCFWSGAGWQWLASQEGEKRPLPRPSSRWVKAARCAASRTERCALQNWALALALTLRRCQPRTCSGCWPLGEPSGKCFPLRCTTADPELQRVNRGKESRD